MNSKLLGAVCIIFACGVTGFLTARNHVARIQWLQNLMGILDFMECELQFRCTPLPQLCSKAGEQSYGVLRAVLLRFAEEMDVQISPDTCNCMAAALDKLGVMDSILYPVMMELGSNLGKFDMAGQLRGLHNVRKTCERKLEWLSKNRDNRLRGYQTLGLCAGAAIVILLV